MGAVYMDRPLLSAVSTVESAAAVDLRGEARDVTIYIKTGAGVSAGVVSIEEADDPDYTGTWSLIEAHTTNTASAQTAVHLTGTYKALRTRVSTAIVGGTVSTRIVAAGS